MLAEALIFSRKIAAVQQKIAAFLMGVCATFAWAPYEQPYMLFLSLSFLVWRLWHCETPRQAIGWAWLWGFGFYMANVFWIGNCLLVDAARFGGLLPLSTFGLPGFLALYFAALGGALGVLRRFGGPSFFVLCFVGFWGLLEWAQGHFFSGFPWNLASYIWAPYVPLAQGVAVVGSYGLSLITVFFFCAPMLCLLGRATFKRFLLGMGVLCLGIGLLFLAGQYRLWRHPTSFHQNFYVRLVQPFIPQKEKGNLMYAYAHFASLVQGTRQSAAHPLTHVLWPEAAIPWTMTPQLLQQFPDLNTEYPFQLIAGAMYQAEGAVWNALVASAGFEKGVTPIYFKKHLVPFGEYIPYRSFLSSFLKESFLKKVTPGAKDVSRGLLPSVVHLDKTPPFHSLICYEAIFPKALPADQLRPEWLLNVTNDAWFGYSPGPYQHFSSARMRAIEHGIPLVRVANSGISAFVDPVGRIAHSLGLNQQGVVDSFLPRALSRTVYDVWGHLLFWLLAGGLFCVAYVVGRYERRSSS